MAAVQPPQLRDELLLKVYSAWVAEPSEAAALVADHERHHAERLAFYRGLLEWMEPAWDADARAVTSPWFGSVAIVRRGVGYEREYLDWCRWLLETLNGHEAAHGRAAAERDGAPPHG